MRIVTEEGFEVYSNDVPVPAGSLEMVEIRAKSQAWSRYTITKEDLESFPEVENSVIQQAIIKLMESMIKQMKHYNEEEFWAIAGGSPNVD